MSEGPLATVYASLLASLEELLVRSFAWPSPESGFGTFVFHRAGEEGPLPRPAVLTWPNDDHLLHAPSLAAAGYWLACGEGAHVRAAWLDGIDRLSRRDPFPTDRQSFVHRPVELFGIAAGLAACGNERPPLVSWMMGVLERVGKEPADDLWSTHLRLAAELVLASQPTSLSSRIRAQGGSLSEAALARWVARSLACSRGSKDDEVALLREAIVSTVDRLDTAHAAVLYQSLRGAVAEAIESEVEQHWQVGRPQQDAEELVVSLCRRFHVFAQQLLVRHGGRNAIEVSDEYDVQDLMYALLRLHFEDVRPEEVTPSLAGKSGRMDFLLKRERIVVETNMTRKNLKQKEVGDELIIDMTRYRTHPDCRTLVCLVYDPGGLCHAPTALEDDLMGLGGDLRTRVIVCPKGT
jgi:hypothetical protein